MLTTYETLFCDALDSSIPALSDIDVTYREQGIQAAEKQLADYIRATLRVEDYFTIPYKGRENVRRAPTDSELEAAEKILEGELCSCGFSHKFSDTAHVDWECNPTPNQYAEWTWQLSRHPEWRCLGYCYRLTGDEKYTKGFVDLMMSWCEQAECPVDAPFYQTKCWRTIEAGIRMTLNWHYAFYAFIHSPLMTDHVITTFIRSICDHGYRLRNFGSGGGNWRAMEMAGLAHISMLFPFLKNAKEWGKQAFSVLEVELDNQIYADGFQFELSTNYHDVVVVNYHRVFATAHAMGYPVPQGLTQKLLRLFELDINVTCPDGRYPDLNDGSRDFLAHWCGIGLNYFPDHPSLRWFATEGREGTPPAHTSVALPYSGLPSCARDGERMTSGASSMQATLAEAISTKTSSISCSQYTARTFCLMRATMPTMTLPCAASCWTPVLTTVRWWMTWVRTAGIATLGGTSRWTASRG